MAVCLVSMVLIKSVMVLRTLAINSSVSLISSFNSFSSIRYIGFHYLVVSLHPIFSEVQYCNCIAYV